MKNSESDHARGAAAPVITIIEYGDYECPHTRAAERVVRRLLEENPDVRVVYRHFPLTHLHPDAAARAALAESSTEFWDTHDHLMAGVVSETPDIDDDAMDAVRERIAQGVDEARAAGVESTPTFFFGEEKFDGRADYESLSRELRAARERRKQIS